MIIKTNLRDASADAEDTDIPANSHLEEGVVHNPKTLLAGSEVDRTSDQESTPADHQVQTYKAGQDPASRFHLHFLARVSLPLE